uniref:WAC domain-containing protein n=1 Tax=Romanomermis culicivorax TaxID=13658 RepID=A0A915KQH4_ROMCU
MPLLRNEPFVRLPVPIDLKPDEEVFFCELTSEVFRKYDDYFNRTILLNSMVWTCSVTGKSGLTYEEAAKSEKSFRKKRGKAANGNSPVKGSTAAAPADENTPTTTQSLNESLTPALEKAAALLTMLTGRGFMNDLLADLYTHLKDHYVVDDIVEFMLKDGKKKTGKIIAVEYCGKDKNGEDSIEQHRYSVEVSDGKKDKGKLFTVVYKDVIRRKSILSKTRCRNFIKTYCEVADSTIYKLKDSAKLKFNINDDQKFTSAWRRVFGVKSIQPPFPYTPLSRKPGGHSVSEQLAANCEFVAKNEQPNFDASALEKRQLVVLSLESELQRLNLWPVNQVIFTLQTEEAESAMAKLREDLKIGREMEKERIKEEKKKMLEWKKMRDDLECDDHKPFPNFPILTLPGGLTDEQFGDCISLQNFLYSFALNSNNNDDIFDQDDESLQQFEMSKKLDKKFVNSLHENFLSKLSSTSLNVNENAFLKLLQWFLAAVLEKCM